MSSVSTALITGGGIAGPSVTVALARAGARREVVELAHSAAGASIGSSRVPETLDELGAYDALHAISTPFDAGTKLASQTDAAGRVLSVGPPRPQWGGAKSVIGIHRPALLQTLGNTAQEIGGSLTLRPSSLLVHRSCHGRAAEPADAGRRSYRQALRANPDARPMAPRTHHSHRATPPRNPRAHGRRWRNGHRQRRRTSLYIPTTPAVAAAFNTFVTRRYSRSPRSWKRASPRPVSNCKLLPQLRTWPWSQPLSRPLDSPTPTGAPTVP